MEIRNELTPLGKVEGVVLYLRSVAKEGADYELQPYLPML